VLNKELNVTKEGIICSSKAKAESMIKRGKEGTYSFYNPSFFA